MLVAESIPQPFSSFFQLYKSNNHFWSLLGSPTIRCHFTIFHRNIHSCRYGPPRMATVPQTLQLTKAARKKKTAGSNSRDQFMDCVEQEQPMRYNSKLMNSIWGRYNEYSVHNFKSLQCAGVAAASPYPERQDPAPHQSPAAERRDKMRQHLETLGQAVAANFMDNLNQY